MTTDSRPTIHIWQALETISKDQTRRKFSFSFSRDGVQHHTGASSVGDTVDKALSAIDRRSDVVVIVEPYR